MSSKRFSQDFSEITKATGLNDLFRMMTENPDTGTEYYATLRELMDAYEGTVLAKRSELVTISKILPTAPAPTVPGLYEFSADGTCTWLTAGAVSVNKDDNALVYKNGAEIVREHRPYVKLAQELGDSESVGVSQKTATKYIKDVINTQKIIAGNDIFLFSGYVNLNGIYNVQGDDSNNVCTDFLELTNSDKLECTNLQGFSPTLGHASFYSDRSENSFISSYIATSPNVLLNSSNIPESAKYVRLNRNKTAPESIIIFNNTIPVKSLQGELSDIGIDNENRQKILNGIDLFTIQGYVNKNTGEFDASSGFKRTDYLPIDLFIPGTVIDMLDVEGAFRQCSFFSEKSKNGLISSYTSDNARTIVLTKNNIPAIAKYVIFNTVSSLNPKIKLNIPLTKSAIPVNSLLPNTSWKYIDPTTGYSVHYGRLWDGDKFNAGYGFDWFYGKIYDVSSKAGKEAIHVKGRFYSPNPIVVFFQDQSLTAFVANGEKHGTIENGAYYDFYENVPPGANYAYVQQSRTGHGLPFTEMVEDTTEIEIKKKVILVGNSETQMADYADELMLHIKQIAPEYELFNYGIGGEKTNEICSRIGAFQMFLNPENSYLSTDSQTGQKYITLPADTSSVEIGLNAISNSWNSDKLALLRQQTKTIDCWPDTVYVDGIECLLTWSGSSYFLNRITAASSSHKLFVGTQLVPKTIPFCTKNDIAIVNIGQNGGWTNTNDLVAQYKRIIEHLGTDKYIVISTHYAQNSDSGRVDYIDNRVEQENALKKEFGSKYINMREYLCRNALYEALSSGYWNTGNYPTDVVGENHPNSTDTEYMSNGLYAPMWWCNPNSNTDIIHLSRRTYFVYYKHIFNVIKSLKYLN